MGFIKNLFKRNKQAEEGQAQPKKLRGKMAGILTAAIAVFAAVPSVVGAAPMDFSTQEVGIDVNDVVGTGFSFMNMFGQYTMLVLGVIFAPVAIGFIIWLWKKLPKFSK
mgnify:CR=1 FL=1|jgi:hypothetical protein